jgi:septal ring factor EnvC (AmiA/AmiB activator)
VILDHGKGSLSVYGNLDEVFVINGDVIDQNYTLGTVAYNEMEKRYLFYFETRHNRRAVDPEQWLKKPAWR